MAESKTQRRNRSLAMKKSWARRKAEAKKTTKGPRGPYKPRKSKVSPDLNKVNEISALTAQLKGLMIERIAHTVKANKLNEQAKKIRKRISKLIV